MTLEGVWRLAPALLLLLVLAAAEWRWPWRAAAPARWWGNLSLGALSALITAVLPLASMSAAAQWASDHGFGLLHWLTLPPLLAGLLAFVLLDLAVYAQHRALHSVSLLWRLHRVHHSDVMLDVTSGLRFHPFEAAVSAFYKAAMVALLGAPLPAAIAFAIGLNLASLFTHANIRLPQRLDRMLRWLFVTPALHRIHHSAAPGELMHNYGFLLNIWDRLFASWRAEPLHGEALQLGLPGAVGEQRIGKLLADPFLSPRVQ